MRALCVDYVALSNGPRDPTRRTAASLRDALLDNEPVGFLEDLGAGGDAAVRL